MAAPTLRQWLTEAPFSVGLSAGFFGFFAHAGFMAALEDAGLVPQRITGSSAGALTGGLWAAGLEAARLRDALRALKRSDFWDPAPGFGLLRGARFAALLRDLLPVTAFEQCRVQLAVSAYDVWARRTQALGVGALGPAIQASCTVPGLFHPLSHQGRLWLDGGLLDRPGLTGMPTHSRVLYHHLISSSPWRLGPGIEPRRRDLITIRIRELPRLGPFRLAAGMTAFDRAALALRAALDLPIAPAGFTL